MLRPTGSTAPSRRRSGKVLVMSALLLPVLLGMVGLVIDTGMLWAAYRQTQNTADAAAMAAAMDLMTGNTNSNALTTANSFVTLNSPRSPALTLNNGTIDALNIPPSVSTAFGGQANYVEAVVSLQVSTTFIQILGVNRSQTISARSVAGFEPIAAGQGAIVLDPTAAPGIALNGTNTRLIVNGGITDNSLGGGVDQYGNTVTSPLGNSAKNAFVTSNATQNPAPVVATAMWVSGGIDNVANFQTYDAGYSPNFYNPNNTDIPVVANLQKAAPDPLASLPTPTTSNGVVQTYPQYLGNGLWTTASSPQSVSIGNSSTVTFSPGIYQSISISGGNVTFNPGIYVVGPGLGNGNGQQTFSINGGTVTGSGVMIYNTGSDYTSGGSPDSSDSPTTLGTDKNANFGIVSIGGNASVTFTPISDPSSPFNGILFYQRRYNTQAASVGGNTSTLSLSGTIYDKWGNFALAGQGTYNAEFVVGSMSISGGAAVTINATGKNTGRLNQVFLVE
jgi:hypothetical protein